MIGRHPVVSLGKLFKFPSEYIVHLEGLRDLPRDIATMCSWGIPICFLQKDQVCPRSGKKLNYLIQLLAAIDVPVDNPDRIRKLDLVWRGCE